MLTTKLGDLLLAGVLKHPDEAGKLVTEALVQAEASAAATAVPAAPAPKVKDAANAPPNPKPPA